MVGVQDFLHFLCSSVFGVGMNMNLLSSVVRFLKVIKKSGDIFKIQFIENSCAELSLLESHWIIFYGFKRMESNVEPTRCLYMAQISMFYAIFVKPLRFRLQLMRGFFFRRTWI